MDHPIDHSLQQTPDATTGQVEGLAGCWKLGAGRALTLQARHAGVLRIAHGRVWATFDHAEQDSSVRVGDHFLSRGESLSLQPGESLVMESFGIGHASSAYFSWEPARVASPVPVSRAGVAQSLVDLRLASGLAARAVGRLGRVLAGGVMRLAGRAVEPVATGIAISFVAVRARCTSAERTFGAQTCER